MYLKRTSKLLDLTVSRTTADVNLRDLTCPVCRGILIEPVTLPCTHNLCLRCLQGTFKHNSLSCPLCRLRVGSWVRNATRSETLVNHGLWELIRSKFPKEVENKHNGEEVDLGLDSEYAANRILSAAGEIHREYKAQLKMAEEEMRREREAEEMASRALIQKITTEEQQLLKQMKQDQSLAKTMAKDEQKKDARNEAKYCNDDTLSISSDDSIKDMLARTVILHDIELEKPPITYYRLGNNIIPLVDSTKRCLNKSVLKKKYPNISSYKDLWKLSASRFESCCARQMRLQSCLLMKDPLTNVSKYTIPCAEDYFPDNKCSTSKATETKEELLVPSDVVNKKKKKSLEVKVCTKMAADAERIGSAESSGSHDSINQEIHHFKPIKTVPRTKLLISPDGKQIDPKLVKVPTLRKVSNAVPKPPSATYVKHIGGSCSAFEDKTRQNAKKKYVHSQKNHTVTSIDHQEPSTSFAYYQTVSNTSTSTSQTNGMIRQSESSFDSNKNTNKIINDTKITKKLLDDESDVNETGKSWKTNLRRDIKPKQYGNPRRKKTVNVYSVNVDKQNDNPKISNSSFCKISLQTSELDTDVSVGNTTVQIKKRKESAERETESEMESSASKRSRIAKKKFERIDKIPAMDQVTCSESTSQENSDIDGNSMKRKRRNRSSTPENLKNCSQMITADLVYGLRKSLLDSESDSTCKESNFNYYSPPESSDNTDVSEPENERTVDKVNSVEEVVEQQERIERLLLQEQEDFKLARRLQAQYEMEGVARRTRRSRQAVESGKNVNLREINTSKTVGKTGVRKTVKRKSVIDQTASTAIKSKRGRPKGKKITGTRK